MYIRLKRKNQTVFLHVDASENFAQIKQRLATLFNKKPNEILVYADADKRKEYLDMSTVSDQEIRDDAVVYMVFLKDAGGFEEIAIEKMLPLGSDPFDPSSSSHK